MARSATLGQLLEDRSALLGDQKREAAEFRIVWRHDMGMARKAGGKNPGFIDTVVGLIDGFYGEVLQNIRPWVAPAPKLKRPPQLTADANNQAQDEPEVAIVSETVEG